MIAIARRVMSVLTGCLFLQSFRHFSCSAMAFTSLQTPVRRGISVRRMRSTSLAVVGNRSSTFSRVKVSAPSQAESESLGIREWPQQSRKGSWNEQAVPDKSLVRYILDGSGSLTVMVADDGEEEESDTIISVKPGTLIEVQPGTPQLLLEWECDSKSREIIVLTPGYEDTKVLLGVVAGVFLLFGALLSGALG